MAVFGKPDKVQRSYANSAKKYAGDDPRRFQWYGFTKEQLAAIQQDTVNLIPKNVKTVLEVGCGVGFLAELIRTQRPDIHYRGFDIVQQNVQEAQERNPGLDIFQGNYWKVLADYTPGDWEFVISVGVLFTTTDPEHRELLLTLLDRSSPKGFISLCLGGSWGLSSAQKADFFGRSLSNSVGETFAYYKGKRAFYPQNVITYQHPFILFREGVIETPNLPKVPLELLEYKEPELIDDPEETFFIS